MFTHHTPIGRWSDLVARLEGGILAGWSEAEPALSGVLDAPQLVAAWAAEGGSDVIGDALGRLAAVTGRADDDALLALLHLMSPVVSRLSKELRDLSPRVTFLVVGELTCQIRGYTRTPGTGSVVAAWVRGTRRALLKEVRCIDRHRPDRREVAIAPPRLIELVDATFSVGAVDEGTGVVLGDLVAWALDAGADERDLHLLIESEVARERRGSRADERVARAKGIARRTVIRRRQRALTALRRVAPDYIKAVA